MTALTVWTLFLAMGAAAAPRPASGDLILISVDDLRADRIRPDLMPHLTSLAAESIFFQSAYSQATWTLPSHASLLLSQYPWTHGAGGFNALHPRAPSAGSRSLAGVLDEHGYATASFANCGFFEPAFGLVDGFSVRVVTPMQVDPLEKAFDWFLSSRASASFLFAHTYAVHNYLDAQDPPKDSSGAWRCPLQVDPLGRRGDSRLGPQLTCEESTVLYDRAAHCLDEELGRLFDRLKRAGRWNATLVAVVADHGEGLCDGPPPGRRLHNDLGYDEQTRVPWIMKLPTSPVVGRVVGTPVELIDAAPTILSALSLPSEPRFSGRNRLRDVSIEPVYSETDRGAAVRADNWKLVRGRWGQSELYDLESDPGEGRDLATTRPDQFARLDALLRLHAGSQPLGWRAAVRGKAGEIFHIEVRSNRRLTTAIPLFVEQNDPQIVVSTDGLSISATFGSQSDADEDWLIFESADSSATVTIDVRENGLPLSPARTRLGSTPTPGHLPWVLSSPELRALAAVDAVPEASDGLNVWRWNGSGLPRAVKVDSRTGEALRAAGYLR